MRVRAVSGVALLASVAGCKAQPETTPATRDTAAMLERRMPSIPVFEIAPATDTVLLRPAGAGARDPFAGASARRVTLTTANADARQLMIWLAQQAGVSLVVSEDVNARVTVSFQDVLAVDALRSVMAEAGLSVLTSDARAPWAPVVFYQLPVNIEQATPEVIAARFGVSLEMARFIVASRPRQ